MNNSRIILGIILSISMAVQAGYREQLDGQLRNLSDKTRQLLMKTKEKTASAQEWLKSRQGVQYVKKHGRLVLSDTKEILTKNHPLVLLGLMGVGISCWEGSKSSWNNLSYDTQSTVKERALVGTAILGVIALTIGFQGVTK